MALAAGWRMGRAIPAWWIDRMNEAVRGGHSGGGGGCGNLGIAFMQGAWGVVILGFGALILASFGWREPQLLGVSDTDSTDFDMMFTRAFWWLLLAAIAGYVASRLTDKGPVGPLE